MPVRRLVAAAGLAAVATFALTPLPSYAAGPTDVYVSDSGSDTNDCSEAMPCATVATALAAVADGGTIHVGSGTFDGPVTIDKSVTITGTSTDQTLLTTPQDGGPGYVLAVTSGTTALSDLTVQGGLMVDVYVLGTGHLDASHVLLAAAGCNVAVGAGSAVLKDSTVQDGGGGCYTPVVADFTTGEVVVTGGTVSLVRSQVLSPVPDQPGVRVSGGVFNADQSSFDDSAHPGDMNKGMAVDVAGGSATLTRSTVRAFGAGLYTVGGTALAQDDTFLDNLVGVDGGVAASTTVVRTTFEHEMASLQGEVSVAGSVLGSMLGTPAIGIAECNGTITDLGYNLSSDTSCAFTDQHSRENVGDLHLDTGLADRGGPVPTVAVLWPTPAADTIPATATYGPSATPLCTGTDLRGVPRPQAGACDAGSMEMVATTTSLTAPATAKPHADVLIQATVAVSNVGVDRIGDLVGSVTFRSGTTVLCQDVAVTGGAAQCLTTALGAGRRPVAATFTPIDTRSLHARVSATRTVKVGTAPAFISSSRVTFVVGQARTFRVRAAGSPAPRVTLVKGRMPAGLTFKAGTGSATISGRAKASGVGRHVVTVRATNLRGSVRQVLTIVVSRH